MTGVERVKAALAPYGLADRILTPEETTATVEEAAEALGTEPCRIAKTMSFRLPDRIILIVMAGDVKVDNRKYKDTFRAKAAMLGREEVEDLVGHAVGGVCPFAVKEGVTVYLDESLRRFDTVYPAAGDRNSAVRLSPAELERASRADSWVDVTKPIEA